MDWLFPPACAGCGAPGIRWCQGCIDRSKKFPAGICPVCQQALTGSQHTCPRAEHLGQVFAWGWHSGPLRKAIHRLKYQRDISLGENLSAHLKAVLDGAVTPEMLVVPVPLWPARQRQRGYNQAALLARPLAYGLKMAYRPKAVSRQRNTASQVGLSISERRENMAGAFVAAPTLVAGKQVLLVDDVLTTGATLDAAAHAMRQAGAEKVHAVVLARAL